MNTPQLPPRPSARCLDRSFVVLVLATLAMWYAGEHTAGPLAAALLIVVAFIKGRLVIREFMGLAWVKFKWRALLIGWLIVVLGIIALAYRLAPD